MTHRPQSIFSFPLTKESVSTNNSWWSIQDIYKETLVYKNRKQKSTTFSHYYIFESLFYTAISVQLNSTYILYALSYSLFQLFVMVTILHSSTPKCAHCHLYHSSFIIHHPSSFFIMFVITRNKFFFSSSIVSK